jgi:hypothetical protein
MRDSATHTDVRNEFLLEADVRPIIDRMEQAPSTCCSTRRDGGNLNRSQRGLKTDGGNNKCRWRRVHRPENDTADVRLDTRRVRCVSHGSQWSPRPSNCWPQTDSTASNTEEFEVRMIPKD